MACDLCGKTGTHIHKISERYKTADIQQVCDNCADDMNKLLDKLQDIGRSFTQKMLIKLMKNKREDILKSREK